tara:strand:- start:35 stop:529 length:495 start_codon:yes stop_codon:yes gene_type:complete
MKLENGAIIEAESFTEGNDVFIVTEDEKVALPDGTYTLEDSQVLVAKDGVIVSIGEEAEPEEAKEEVEAEEEKEEMKYATKEELAEVKELVEEIKAMITDKEKMNEQVKEEKAELQEQLAEAAVKPISHKPEKSNDLKKVLNITPQRNTTFSRVLDNLNKFKNN